MPGGRPKGSKNKEKRAFRDRIKEYCAAKGIDPFEFMVDTIGKPRVPYALRLKAAAELAQYLEPKLRAVEVTGNPDKPLVIQDPEARKARITALINQISDEERLEQLVAKLDPEKLERLIGRNGQEPEELVG